MASAHCAILLTFALHLATLRLFTMPFIKSFFLQRSFLSVAPLGLVLLL